MKFQLSSLFCITLPVIVFLFCSCNQAPQPVRSTSHIRMMDDTLLNYHKAVVKTEDQEIEDFLRRYGWKMQKTRTGLRYMIYSHGQGEKATLHKKATIRYEIRLINGDLCYSSENMGLKEFTIGRGGIVPGAEEGILFMHVGDKAKFIVPSHLAFGLLGDQDKIPPQATLIYDIELLKLN